MKNMFKALGFIALIAVIGMMVVGCAPGGGTLTGTWVDKEGIQTFKFTGNKWETEFTDKGMTYAANSSKMPQAIIQFFIKGNYTINGDIVTLTTKEIRLGGLGNSLSDSLGNLFNYVRITDTIKGIHNEASAELTFEGMVFKKK
ncbi:MAG: hypothetical protein LBU99_01310 [Spirochaetaceae bacterium]|nr:hypothetical protein [Spirochaetaceae bacterium]